MATVCTGFIEPLNLQCLFVNIFAGSMDIFITISMILIAAVGAYFRMLNSTLLIMYAVFGIVMGQFFGGLYLITLLIAGLIVAYSIAKVVKN